MSNEQFIDCIDACNECAIECENCASTCLEDPNVNNFTECIRLNRYCADICRITATFLSRGEGFSEQICSLCAEICEACADECSKYQMEHCQICADTCRTCADECKNMF